MKNVYWVILIILFLGCQDINKPTGSTSKQSMGFEDPPKWAKEAIWYEIGVERFRNGDPSNDPTSEDIVGAYPGFVPEGWSITPWTQDWYKQDAYFSNAKEQTDVNGNTLEKFVDFVQMRRYGGDLQGVLDKMDYLDSLGVTAIYFRPLNDAPSLHKYDARNWRHIDVNFGPNPQKDKETMASEVPDDPSTWKTTEADRLFLKVIDEFHKMGIKVILDYSWNHTGKTFWAWQDVLRHQEKSKYKDWYWIENFDDPKTSENEFEYHGWVGVPSLPEIKETQKQDASKSLTAFEGNIYNESAKQHMLDVAERWLDPNGDGDPSDGVDGYRLDVAAETPLGFWRDFRIHVRQINPEAYLLGEIWWEEWPDKLLDPAPFLKGDVFDAVMNYRWYRAVRHFFNESPHRISATELIDSLNSFKSTIRRGNNYSMMNYTGGFDTPRILTSLFNKNKYKYYCKVHENPDYKIHKPDSTTFGTLKLLLVHQYTYTGAPHIYAGDEMGMWGADDPSSRKPLIWPDYSFEDETTHPMGKERPTDKVKFNEEMFNFHQMLIKIRKTNPVLVHGEIEFIKVGGSKDLLAYRRYDDIDEIIVVFNHMNSSKKIEIPKILKREYKEILGFSTVEQAKEKLVVTVPPRKVSILKYRH
ncbi:MAG: glycoside hydrolase family 13 protein [Bacteroidota bacterium]